MTSLLALPGMTVSLTAGSSLLTRFRCHFPLHKRSADGETTSLLTLIPHAKLAELRSNYLEQRDTLHQARRDLEIAS